MAARRLFHHQAVALLLSPMIFTAHDSRIAFFELTLDGSLLATSSSKGTLIRIFNTLDATRLQEVHRGADIAEIYSLAFPSNHQWLAVSSDKGTIDIFSLNVPRAGEDPRSVDAIQGLPATNGSGGNLVIPSPGANPSPSLSFMKEYCQDILALSGPLLNFTCPRDYNFL